MCPFLFLDTVMQTLIRTDYSEKFEKDLFYESDLFTCLFSPKWKQRKLWVQVCNDLKVLCLPSEGDKQWLVQYLSRSPIEAVCLNSDLGEISLAAWADACRLVGKPAFLRLSSRLIAKGKRLPSRKGIKRRLHQMMDWVVALAILLIFSPLMLVLILFIRTQSNQPTLMREWCVGQQGRIFQLLTFNSRLPLGLGRLPTLVSVLRGETNLRQTDHCSLHQILQV